MRVGKHPPHFPGPLRIPVLLELWQEGKASFLRAAAAGTHCRGSSSLGVPQNLWIIDALSPNHSLIRARLTQRAALKNNEPWKTVFAQFQCTWTPTGVLVPFQTMEFAGSELLVFLSPQLWEWGIADHIPRGTGISWLMCVKVIRGWHGAVTQSHTSTLISSCQNLSAYFWYRFYTWAYVTHSGPHPLQISAPDCI